MSDHVIGTVEKITEKATRNGGTIYNVCLNTGGRDDEWFGYGFDEPQFQEGDEIEFDIEYNGDYANVAVNSVVIVNEGSGNGRSSSRSSSRSSGGRDRGGRNSSSSSNKRPSSGVGGSRRDKPASKGRTQPAVDDKMSKDEWADKDKMIRRQACMNTAINLVKLLNEAGVLPAIKKKSDGVDAIIALCDEEAERLYDQYEEQVYPKPKAKSSSRRGGRGTQEDDDQYDDDIPE